MSVPLKIRDEHLWKSRSARSSSEHPRAILQAGNDFHRGYRGPGRTPPAYARQRCDRITQIAAPRRISWGARLLLHKRPDRNSQIRQKHGFLRRVGAGARRPIVMAHQLNDEGATWPGAEWLPQCASDLDPVKDAPNDSTSVDVANRAGEHLDKLRRQLDHVSDAHAYQPRQLRSLCAGAGCRSVLGLSPVKLAAVDTTRSGARELIRQPVVTREPFSRLIGWLSRR